MFRRQDGRVLYRGEGCINYIFEIKYNAIRN